MVIMKLDFTYQSSHPYHELHSAGIEVTFTTLNGKPAPVDPSSVKNFTDPASVSFLKEFIPDGKFLTNVKKLSTLPTSGWAIVFFPGGHGPMFDLAASEESGKFVAEAYENNPTVVGAVCHGPAGLVPVYLSNKRHIVEGQMISCFTDREEEAVKLVEKMPFALETKLRQLGARTVSADLWKENAVTSGRIVTGQNPASGYKYCFINFFVF